MIQRNNLWFITFFLGAALVIVAFLAGSNRPANFIFKDQVAVLMYHHISFTAKSNITITPDLLQNQLSYLQKRGYHFITAHEFRNYLSGGPVADNAVLVTFDDGYESFYKRAYPILKKLNIPAVNFVVTKGLDNSTGTNIPYLSKKEITEMTANDKAINVQCHSDNLHTRSKDGSYMSLWKIP